MCDHYDDSFRCECGAVSKVPVWPLHCGCGKRWSEPGRQLVKVETPPVSAARSKRKRYGGLAKTWNELLRAKGIQPGRCRCNDVAALLARWGPQVSRDNLEQLLDLLDSKGSQLNRDQWRVNLLAVLENKWQPIQLESAK